MLIAFVHNKKALLPEIAAYRHFFEGKGLRTTECLPAEIPDIHPDIEWHFMGTHYHRKFRNNLVIHEYASLSAPPFRKIKDLVKRETSTKPDFRIFMNEYIRNSLSFNDGIPWGYRNMIYVKDDNPPQDVIPPLYDFIYAGTLDKSREPHKWLDCFAEGGSMSKRTVLVLSERNEYLQRKYKACSNIRFAGPVPPDQVAGYVHQCRFGINYQPDREPFNRQPSAKLLTYAACGLPVVSTDYAWVREFQQQYGGNYFFLKTDLSNFTWENLNRFHFAPPDLSECGINFQLKQSGVCEFLASRTGMKQLATIE